MAISTPSQNLHNTITPANPYHNNESTQNGAK